MSMRAAILLFALSLLPHAAFAQPQQPAQQQPAPAKPTTDKKPAASAPLTVRAEGFTHEDFARVIFRTGTATKFKTSLSGNQLSVIFDMPVKVDTADLLKTLQGHIAAARASADSKTIILTLASAEVKVRRFIGEDFVGVDLIGGPAPAAVTAVEKKSAPAQKTAEVVATNPPATAPSSIVPEAAKLKKEEPRQKPVSILPAVKTVTVKPLPVAPSAKTPDAKTSAAPVIGPMQPGAQAAINTKSNAIIPTFKEADAAFPWLDPSQHKPKPRVIAKPKQAPVESEDFIGPSQPVKETATGEEPAKKEDVDKTVLLVGRQAVDKGIQLNFPWTQETAAAVFARGQYIWAVFNAPVRLDLANIKGIKYLDKITQITNKQYAILRIRIPAGFRVDKEGGGDDALALSVNKNGYQWSVTLQEDAAQTGSNMSNPVVAESGVRDGRTGVFLQATQVAEPLLITDDAVGDQLIVIPLAKPQNGVAPSYNFVDFSLPQTAQGIVIRKITDTVSYQLVHNGIEISSADQMSLSPELFKASTSTNQQAQSAERAKKIVLPSETVFPFMPRDVVLWHASLHQPAEVAKPEEEEAAPEEEEGHGKKKEEEAAPEEEKEEAKPKEEVKEPVFVGGMPMRFQDKSFMELRDELYYALETAPDDKKSDQRLEIARFFFQEGLYSESLGVLREIKILDPIYANMYDVDLTMAANNYLLERYTESVEQFQKLAREAQGLASYDELRLWEWSSRYKLTQGEHEKTTEDMPVDYIASYDKFMQQYPDELRYAFGLVAAEAKLEREDPENADLILQVISGSSIPPRYVNDTKFMQGMVANAKNNVELAESTWEDLTKEVDDRYNRARATFELTKLKLVHGQVTVQQAVDTFSQLSVVWRGDTFELDLLKLVGQLYVRESNYLEGLRAWDVLVKNFPDTKEAIYIAGKMKKIFVQLFDEGDAYKLPPKDALALYFEFRQLTPVGERGDRIIQQLADHFIKADLLDNAAALLQHQIEFRAQGKLKNELVLKLGELQLSNKKPAKTIEALAFLDKGAADDATSSAAKYLRARAELAMNEYNRVLETLQDDFSESAQNIRLEVFWHQENWFGITHIIEGRLDAIRETGPFPLKPHELEDIVKLSVAYGTQEEREKLRMLKREFAERIDSAKVQNIFGFVTNDIPSINYRRFDETVQLKEIETFMNEYAFWPGKDWQNVANVLEPQVELLKRDAPPLNRDEEKTVVRLAIAYAMLTHSDKPEQAKLGEQNLSRLSRDFRNVTVNRNTLDVFSVLDDKFTKKNDDAVFEGTVPLKEVPNFVEQYQAARSISELNAVAKP